MIKISGWGSIFHRVLIDTLLISAVGCLVCFTLKFQTFSPSISQGILNITGDDYGQKEMGKDLSDIIKNVKNTTQKADMCLESVNNILGSKKDQIKMKNNLLEITKNTNKCLNSLNKILDNKECAVKLGKSKDIAGLVSKLNTCMDSINTTIGEKSNLAKISKNVAEITSNTNEVIGAFNEGMKKSGGIGLVKGATFDYSKSKVND